MTEDGSTQHRSDLVAAAYALMLEQGFDPSFPEPVEREVNALAGALSSEASEVRDLRAVLWSSIDNPESRDLDQIEYAERLPDETIRVWVGVADVDARVPLASAT